MVTHQRRRRAPRSCKPSPQTLTGPFASCWASDGQQPTFAMYPRCVPTFWKLLPLQLDARKLLDRKPAGQRIAHGEAAREWDGGNHVLAERRAPVWSSCIGIRAGRRAGPLREDRHHHDGISAVLPDQPGAAMSQTIRASTTGGPGRAPTRQDYVPGRQSGRPNRQRAGVLLTTGRAERAQSRLESGSCGTSTCVGPLGRSKTLCPSPTVDAGNDYSALRRSLFTARPLRRRVESLSSGNPSDCAGVGSGHLRKPPRPRTPIMTA